MIMLNKFFILLLILLLPLLSKSQTFGVGASAIYNFQSEGTGAGVRFLILPTSKIRIVPQFSYFFPFNKVEEYTIGLSVEYKFIRKEKVNFYAIAHGGYNSWLNYKSSPMKDAQANNWNLEGGIGVTIPTCLRPFLEYRYNLKFRETHLDLGLIYIFGCRNRKSTSGVDRCPVY